MDIYTFFSFGFLEKDKHFGTSRDKILDKQYETDGVLIDYIVFGLVILVLIFGNVCRNQKQRQWRRVGLVLLR